jgi:RHS repeat-associated protein
MSVVLVPALVAVGIPVSAEPQVKSGPPPAPNVKVNRRTPQPAPPPAYPVFSLVPTTKEIVGARVFGEPLLPVGADPSFQENFVLATAITQWLRSGDPENTRPFETFLTTHPTSVWRASVLANLGTFYKRHGYFTRAEARLVEAWEIARHATDANGRAVAEQVLVDLIELRCSFGRAAALQEVIDQVGSRPLYGVAAQYLERAKTSVWILTHAHEKALPSGPIALGQILRRIDPDAPRPAEITAFHATVDGASVAQIAALSRQVDFPLKPAFRGPDAIEVPIPSVAHINPGHFTAIVGQANGFYILDDPLLGGEVWISEAALREQSSGYFLVPEGPLPEGWTVPSSEAVASVRGKCASGQPVDQVGCGTGGGCGGNPPMAVYSFDQLHAGLIIRDTPVGYAPPVGPDVRFKVRYHQRGGTQPTTLTYGNMGPRWFPQWTAYIEDDPTNLLAPATLVGLGVGMLKFTGFSGDRYAPEPLTRSELVRTSSSPIRYERRNADGSREVYSLADGAATNPRRIFLTESFDPQGQRVLLTYDGQLRLVSLTDAIGQVTTVAYEHPDDPLKVTKVTDPFGRFAAFDYTPNGTLLLEKITDVIGIQSEMTYGYDSFVSQLKTPYGTTSFSSGWSADQYHHAMSQWVEATDPLGGRERMELAHYGIVSPEFPNSEPASAVPTGFAPENQYLNGQNSFYWDKRAMALHPGDRLKAHVTHWAWTESYRFGGAVASEKAPLENRVWYAYVGAPLAGWVGSARLPSRVARVLDDGTSQIHRFEWNAKNMLTRYTDPLGRETVFDYAGDTDLLTVKQRNGFMYELLAELSHNGIHLPLTVKDASAQETVLTYNAVGQPLTVTNAKNETTTLTYDASRYLQTITGPVAGTTVTMTWDAFGRVRTVTYDGRTVTFSYDVLDRVTRVDYPDATYETVTYKLLDPETYRDGFGRVSRLFHDAMQRLVSFQDPQGRVVRQNWCDCGSMDKLIDANGNETRWVRDLQGRVTQQVRANGTSSSVTYETTSSRVKKVTDAKLQDVLYEYFLDDSLKNVSFANAANPPAPVSFTYDSAYPRVLTKADGQGGTTYGYNPIAVPPALGAGQLASIDGPLSNDTITLGYDSLGRVTSRAINSVAESVVFDTLGRLESVTNPLGTFNYSYVGVTERLQSLSYPNGQSTELSYFPAGEDHKLQQILHKKPGGALLSRHAYTYEASGNIKTWTQETDVSAAKVYDFEYDQTDQLTAATLKTTDPTPSIVKRYVYAYDAAGNRTSEQVDNGVVSASHNNMNQITTTQPGGMLRIGGTTNEAANVTVGGQTARLLPGSKFEGEVPVGSGTTSVPVVATDGTGNARTYTYDVSVSGSTKTLTYDANGNLLSDGTRTYEWDARNRLTGVTDGSKRSEFHYDSSSRRTRIIEKSAGAVTSDKSYLWAGRRIVQERSTATGAVLKRYFSHGMQHGVESLYYGQDHLGSIRELVDGTGNVRAAYDYDVYGGRTKSATQGAAIDADLGYAGQFEHSPSGLGLTLYRAYDSALGRWISMDPIGLSGGLNLNAYVHNNPVNYIDPLGLNAESFARGFIQGLATGLVLGLAAAAGPFALAAVIVLGVIGLATTYYQWQTASCDEKDEIVGGLLGGIIGGSFGYGLARGPSTGQVASAWPRGRRVGGNRESPRAADPPAGTQEVGAWEPTPENIAQMERGRPPIGRDGEPVELHHRNQDPLGPLDEMMDTTHGGVPHPLKPSLIDRGLFKGQRCRYWVGRVRRIHGQ